ncbi:MAG TPA: ABC transporter ATP-binding protein [Thermoanaerobaculia bacterium]|nr:ABC transporter ATP-binding protein [Thermoanaerobaculia bacterium]
MRFSRWMSADEKKPRRLRQIVVRQLGGSKGALVWAAFCTLGLTLTELARPWPLKVIFDNILLDKPLPPALSFLRGALALGKANSVVAMSSLIVAISLLRGAFAYSQVHVTSRLGNNMVYTLRRELFAHLQRLSLAFHSRARAGELLTKIASDTNALKDVFAESILTVFSQLLTLVAMLAIMFALDWRLTMIVLVIVPVLGGNLLLLYRKARGIARQQRKKEEKIASRISEVMSSVPLVQAFAREQYEEERFGTESAAYLEESIRNDRIEGAAARAVEVISAAGTCVVVLFGSLAILRGELTIGLVLVFVSYLNGMYRPIRNLAKLSTQLSKATVSAGRIAEILDKEPEVRDAPDAIEAKTLRGEIVFDRVSFGYEESETLRDVSFRVAPGERFAIMGASGAGKSTLVSLILRLYDPAGGTISVDGIDIRRLTRESLRREIGLVLQGSILFGTSVRENIAYGKLDATTEEIVAAAKAANAHEFIEDLEDGYETILGERGSTLSGGQRQRLAIARALVRGASILILDEPMTGLDIEAEAKLKEALDRLMSGKTCILITHDLKAAAEVDRVLLLEGGRTVDCGTHEELLARSPLYKRLFELKTDWRLTVAET